MANENPGDWLERKRTEFGSFNLSALNFFGWLLFLSTLVPMVVGISLLVQTPEGGVVANDTQSRSSKKAYGALILAAMVGWFLLGKLLLQLMGFSIYRKGRVQDSRHRPPN